MTIKLGPALELQGAIVAQLRATADVCAFIGGKSDPDAARIYEDVRPSKDWPGDYLTLGDFQELGDNAEKLKASELFPIIHAWSRVKGDEGWKNHKRLCAAVRRALDQASLTMTENTFVLIEFERSDTSRDPDGITRHTAITFRALTNNS